MKQRKIYFCTHYLLIYLQHQNYEINTFLSQLDDMRYIKNAKKPLIYKKNNQEVKKLNN